MFVPRTRHVFGLLDGFRGIAALWVMLYHYGPFLSDGMLRSSYLAPVVWILEWLTLHGLHRPAEALQPASGLVFAAVIIVRAELAVRYYEPPAMRLLGRLRLNPAGQAPLAG